MYAVTEMKVRLYEQRTQLQLTEGWETLPTPSNEEARQVKNSDFLAEGIRSIAPYAVSRSLCHTIDDNRTRRFTATLLSNVLVALPEMWRMEARSNLYTKQISSSQQLALVPKERRFSGDSKMLATLERVAPFLLYETILAALGEYVVKPKVSEIVKDKLTFVTTEKELDAWSAFLTDLLLRLATVPLEKQVKQSLAGVVPKTQAPTDRESEKSLTQKRWKALFKTVVLTVPVVAAPLLHLYAYRGLSTAFDSMGL